MVNCNPIVMLTNKDSNLQNSEPEPHEDEKSYQALIGSLTYAVMSTRPNVGYITQFLLQLNKSPTKNDWNTVK